jgi:flagellar capping protein FliD
MGGSEVSGNYQQMSDEAVREIYHYTTGRLGEVKTWQLIITLATLILAIFGVGWINLQMLESYLDAKIDGLRGEMNARFDDIDRRITALEQRVEHIERQLETLFARFLPKSGD